MTGYKSKRAMAQDKLDSMEREALKLALNVLENLSVWPGFRADIDDAITAIKETLAQPAQEPALQEQLDIALADRDKANADWDAWNLISRMNSALEEIGDFAHNKSTGPEVPDALWEIRLMAYDAMEDTNPPQRPWVGLTDEVQAALWDASRAALPRFHTYATLIEKELRILNT